MDARTYINTHTLTHIYIYTHFINIIGSISDPTARHITVNHCSNTSLNPAVQFIVILTADISNSRVADGRDGGPIGKLIFLDLYQL